MRGVVRNRRARLTIPFASPKQPDIDVECVVDTGFTDYLTLLPAQIHQLGLSFSHNIRVRLADGTITSVRVYDAVVRWHGSEVHASVIE